MFCGVCLDLDWLFLWFEVRCGCWLFVSFVWIVVPVVSGSFTYRLTLAAEFECGVLVC